MVRRISAPYAAVVPDEDFAVPEGDGVLIGVRRVGAGVLAWVEGPAGEAEVPVGADRVPARSAVGRLEDLLETDVDLVRVGGDNADDLVVPVLEVAVVADTMHEGRAR